MHEGKKGGEIERKKAWGKKDRQDISGKWDPEDK